MAPVRDGARPGRIHHANQAHRQSRPRRNRRGLALLLGGLLAIVLFAPVAATEFLREGSPHVAAGETIDDDLYAFGNDVDIAGVVTYDLIVVAAELTVTGEVGGNINALVGQAELTGTVGRSVRIAAGTIEISGVIGGDLIAAGGEVKILEGATIQGDVYAAGGDVEILGDVAGDVRVSSGNIHLDSTVGGDVRLNSDDITLGERAAIAGSLEYTSGDDAAIDDAATIAGQIDRDDPERLGLGDGLVGWLTGWILRLLWLLVAGAVLILLLPGGAVAVASAVRNRPLASVGVGLPLAIFTPIAIVILLITVIGLPIALIALGAYLTALYLSQVFVGLAIGRFILPNSWDDEGRGFNLLAMTLGVLILAGLRLIPLPYLSAAIAALTAIVGLGAVVLGARRRTTALAPAPAPSYGYQANA